MKIRFYILAILMVVLSPSVKAQRIVGELESNTDQDMIPNNDSSAEEGQGKRRSDKKKKKKIPTEVHAWTLDEVYGNKREAIVDTVSDLFFNRPLPEGKTGHYNSLGNLGSPRLSRIFMERKEASDFVFLSPLDQFFRDVEKFKFYNTKSPFMNISYFNCGSKETGYDYVTATFTNNIGKRVNFGAIFDYMYGQGYYLNQSTSLLNGSCWASYTGEKYSIHSFFQHNNIKMAENGGITDELYITDPTSISAIGTSADNIPTRLSSTWNLQQNDVFFFNHHYSIGKYKEDVIDSLTIKKTFIPVTKFFHAFKLGNYQRTYLSYEDGSDFYEHDFMPVDTTRDIVKELVIRNIGGVSLCEGFRKWAAFGINVFAGHELRRYTMPDYVQEGTKIMLRQVTNSENDFFIGGQILRTQGKKLHFDANVKFVLVGSRLADLDVNGHVEFNFPLFKDSAQVAVNGYLKNLAPDYFVQHHHGRHTWFDEDLSKEWKTRVEAVMTCKKTKTTLIASLENIKNYTYFTNEGSFTSSKEFKENAVVRQEGGMIQIFTAQLKQDFALGIFHLDNEATVQLNTKKDILQLPLVNLYHNFYIKFTIAKVLKTQLGADMKFFTKYEAPTYSPSLGRYINQNADNRITIGGHPIVSGYANLDLKKLRFYIQYYHANGLNGSPFWTPFYPISPAGLHIGLCWNFYN